MPIYRYQFLTVLVIDRRPTTIIIVVLFSAQMLMFLVHKTCYNYLEDFLLKDLQIMESNSNKVC